MKIRFLIAAALAALAALVGIATDLCAQVAPRQTPLANFDKRAEQTVHAVESNLTEQSLATEALARQNRATAILKSRVEGLKIERDPLLGMPRLISASRGFLTGPSGQGKSLTPQSLEALPANDQHRVLKAFLNEYAGVFGHDASALQSARVSRDYVTEHNGMRTVIWEQLLDGIPVYEGLLAGHITKRGELVNISSRFVSDAAPTQRAAALRQASLRHKLSASQAIVKAAANLDAKLAEEALVITQEAQGTEKRQAFTASGLRGKATAKLLWLPLNRNQVRLAWRIELSVRARPELYSIVVDANTGEALVRRNLTSYLTPASYRIYTSDSPTPLSPGRETPGFFPQPSEVARQLVAITALSTNASPSGWINDGDNETRGNNVDAHTDRDDDDQADLPRPQGRNRIFDFPLDLRAQPTSYTNASVVNLFYWNNFMHDKLYDLGFTEAAGNFQNDNFGRGGLGADAVQADAQDGGGFDNANFSTPQDGEAGRMQMYIFSGPDPNRDGDLDAEVMCHEYTHGLSNRLVGGDVGIFELQTAGMGEGWSDFYGLTLLSEAKDDVDGNYAAGGYASYKIDPFFTQNYYFGIRRYPYTTDLKKNPLTFKDIDPTQASLHPGIPISPVFSGSPADEVHAQGEVWCVTLWEARANLVKKLGFVEGNKTILQLVTDGMKLAPANPTFLEARDAIIKADEVNTGGDNRSELWLAFAKRGMGYTAAAPTSDTTIGVSETFDVPDDVLIGATDGIMEITVTPHDGEALFASSKQPVFIRITDGLAVTNATLVVTLNTGGTLDFSNNGVAPDVTALNSVYSALLTVPTNAQTLTLTIVISAPEKDPTTNSVTYTIIPVPPNDNFATPIKVPATGGVYLSNNKVATTEPNEPQHAGMPRGGASLWWVYTSPIDRDVLIDTAGSVFDSVIGIYTGNTLKGLQTVDSVNDVGSRKQAFLTLHAVKGVTYHIAIASANTNGTGTVNLRFTPGGEADLNPPVVTVTSPPSGLVLFTNRVLVTGVALDPQPFASGLNQILTRVNSSVGTEIDDGSEDAPIANGLPVPSGTVLQTNWSRVVALHEGVNQIQVTARDNAGNLSIPTTLEVTYNPPDPSNDVFSRAITLIGNTGTNLANTTHAGKENAEPLHVGNNGGKSVWYYFRAPADGLLSLSTTNSGFDTLLAVYVGTRVSALTEIVSNDDAYDGSGFSQLEVGVSANQVYRIAIDGFDGAFGVAYLSYAFTPTTLLTLVVNTTDGGSVNLNSATVKPDTTVSLTATPAVGFEFVGWEGSLTSQQNPLLVVVKANMSLTARFVPHSFTDDFQSGTLTSLPWAVGGNAGWRLETAPSRSTAAGPVVRSLPSSYNRSRAFKAAIAVNPAAIVGGYIITETPPRDWNVSEISDSGEFDAISGKVKWGPFFDNHPRTLSYRVLPPDNAAGIVNFNGIATFDGVDSAIQGDVNTALLAARSGAIGNNQSSSLVLTSTMVAGLASFDFRVSSETNWDFLEFYINDVRQQRWSGEVGWLTYQFGVSAGVNKLEWRYVKDSSLSFGFDAAFIDNLQLPRTGAAVTSTAALKLEMVSRLNGGLHLQLHGESGRTYVVEATSDLVNWQPMSTNVTTDGVIDIIDPQASKVPFRYYRALLR